MTATRRRRHSSLSRPYGEFVDELPDGVSVQSGKTPWQRICEMLVDNPDRWFKLEQTYKGGTTSAVASARKVLEADYDEDVASALSVASRLANPDSDRYEVFLKVQGLPDPDEGDDG